MKNHFTRRRFLATLGATGGATLVGKSLFDVSKVFAGGPYVRPNVHSLTLASKHIQSYIKGIQNMQALSISNPADPRGWTWQGAIHGTKMSGNPLYWNTCAHGNEFFWSWHRMYLYWFERIVRSQSGDPTFALPYWDWQTYPKLPSMFQNPPTGSPVLNVPTPNRNAMINNGTAGVGNQTPGVNAAFAQPIFEGASGAVELIQNPHNNVHVNTGGFMKNIITAAQDPIFFLHHANIDRLWDLWLAQGGSQSDPTTDAAWGSMVFNFYDENANPQTMTSCDVLRAALQLNYKYAGEPAQVSQYCGSSPLSTASYLVLINNCIPNPPFKLPPKSSRSSFEFSVSPQLAQQILTYVQNPANTIYLQFNGVTAPTQPGAVWNVYLGLPAGSVQNIKSPYFVGSYGMYGAGIADQPPDGKDPATFSFPVNTAIATALNQGLTTLPVTFFATTTEGTKQVSTMTVQRAQLTLQTVTAQGTAERKMHEPKVIANVGGGGR